MKYIKALAASSMGGAACVIAGNHKDIERPTEWKALTYGGRFMDRLLPLHIIAPRTSDTWGGDNVTPRDVKNGIEDKEWSYWGGNIVVGDDGKYNLFVCRWPESHPKGHRAWNESAVVRAVSNHSVGPYEVAELIGKGHNPEVFQLEDGRYVCYVINSYYLGKTITGPWTCHTLTFNDRDRGLLYDLSNSTFAKRTDGTYLMICRGGGSWISKDGISPYNQVSTATGYPPVDGKFEDPVVWRDPIQYHMIVNDWHGRIAYYLRSKDGVQWTVDAGEAYMPGVANYEDGVKEEWYKYERIKILQDKHGRAIQANFAVIDCPKRQDLPNDNHSSKNISIPLVPGCLLTIQNQEKMPVATDHIRVKIAAEAGFDPHVDVDLKTVRFGAPEEVDFGRGSAPLSTEKDGDDLIVIFSGKESVFATHNFAGKLLGRTTKGSLLFGYSSLPWVSYDEPILSSLNPILKKNDAKLTVEVNITNYGLTASEASKVVVSITTDDGTKVGVVEGTCPGVKPWETATIALDAPAAMQVNTGYRYEVKTYGDAQSPLLFRTKVEKKEKKKRRKEINKTGL